MIDDLPMNWRRYVDLPDGSLSQDEVRLLVTALHDAYEEIDRLRKMLECPHDSGQIWQGDNALVWCASCGLAWEPARTTPKKIRLDKVR